MREDKLIESYTGVTPQRKMSKIPAKLDFWQSATGLFLGLFMLAHLLFVSSILVSNEVMYKVTKFFEGSFIFGDQGKPIIVSFIAGLIIIVLVAHAFLAMRKFPINYKQFLALRVHKDLMKHGDTTYWVIQAITGFAIFFLAMPHVFIMFTQPENIGPSASSYRFYHQDFYLLYALLLFAVEFHGSIGLYRLCIKWGWFEGLGTKTLRAIKLALTAVCLILGVCSYVAYMKIGHGLDGDKSIQEYRMLDEHTQGKGV